MKKFYQRDWFGIHFRDFYPMDMHKIADRDFYSAFYKKFFLKYSSFDDLPENWKRNKEAVAKFISSRINGNGSVLSIGCGLGYVESCLTKMISNKIIAMEPAEGEVFRWLAEEGKVITINGFFPEALPEDHNVDFAYSNAMDYVFDEKDMLKFLRAVAQTVPEYVMVSASFDNGNFWQRIKSFAKSFLAALRIFFPGQLWGFLRTREDYRKEFASAGFVDVQDGILENGLYWISGKSSVCS